MKEVPTAVKSKSKKVAEIIVNQYETLQEMVDALGEDEVLSLANRQHKQDVCNTERAKYRPSTVTKKNLRRIAYSLCSKERNPELFEQLQQHQGDFEALTAFLDSLADLAKAEIENTIDLDDNESDD